MQLCREKRWGLLGEPPHDEQRTYQNQKPNSQLNGNALFSNQSCQEFPSANIEKDGRYDSNHNVAEFLPALPRHRDRSRVLLVLRLHLPLV